MRSGEFDRSGAGTGVIAGAPEAGASALLGDAPSDGAGEAGCGSGADVETPY